MEGQRKARLRACVVRARSGARGAVRAASAALAVGCLALSASACGGAGSGGGGASASAGKGTVVLGTTDRLVALDPAGSFDLPSYTLILNLYQNVVKIRAGATVPTPDAAKCRWDGPKTYVCTMLPGQRFSNGDPVTAEDVAYSFERITKINAANGPSWAITSLKSVKASGDTVTFELKAPDATWPFVLASSAGAIVDHRVFPDDKLVPNPSVVGSGPYRLAALTPDQLAVFTPNPHYGGPERLANGKFIVRYEQNASTLVSDIQSGQVDIAYRELSPTQLKALGGTSGLQVVQGQGTAIQYVTFNLKTQPGGTDARKHAIRQAFAYLLDRGAVTSDVYGGLAKPLYSLIPAGLPGHTEAFADVYGRAPDSAAAKAVLARAGVKTPVPLTLWYNTDHYGDASADAFQEIQRQLNASGLFNVTLRTAEWTNYIKAATGDQYGVFQLGWFPDYPDAHDYTAPFFTCNRAFMNNHYCNGQVDPLIAQEQRSTDRAVRDDAFAKIQRITAGDAPLIPIWQGGQVAVVRDGVTGVQQTLDPAYAFRFALVGKS